MILLSGQIADGVATLVMGWLIDAYGHRKRWHAAGALIVTTTFIFVFSSCIPCVVFHINKTSFKTIIYSVFAAVFNIGWAIVQIAHMSIVPALSRYDSHPEASNMRLSLFLSFLSRNNS